MSTEHEESISLLERSDSPTESEKGLPLAKRAHAGDRSRWLTVALSAFVLVDLVVYCYLAFTLFAPPGAVDDLELRSQYVGLEEMYAYGVVNSSRLAPVLNKPRVVGQVYPADPHRKAPQDEHLTLTPYGRMAIPDRHLQVSSKAQTIYQFRVVDFGMERCQLRLKLPALDAPLPDPFHFAGDAGVALVDVYEAPVLDRLMDLSTLSWARKPPFRAYVGTFAATPEREVTLPEFPCKWGEVRTFKMSCAPQNPDCVVDVWSSQNTTWGIIMYQHQTV
ncbi:hypothetical protein PHLGIDRAFT_15474 [Phlebiopsis gigantea 11061_1 CR5-6]|uniref:Ubiquitin 3 binding protein But2 C-terminal domain-containing protein n=1 Tax=Phlebiopsis gigantea (strain 11061_1 CR5-6) TaxID=745531 RepID=A0A0C3RTJ8_PHLG1|nr:hypothetical protein PHLGIDRAFT_15474 [Phlebiopsis gigantea 11061_1 CR5-6]